MPSDLPAPVAPDVTSNPIVTFPFPSLIDDVNGETFIDVPVESIRLDGGTQSRVELSESTIAEYAEAIAHGVAFPPVVLFYDGTTFWLADGFHRYFANKAAGVLDITAAVHVGMQRDAILYSVGANAAHGMRRTNEDKRRAVDTLLKDEEWVQWSDTAIAKACSVSANFVGDRRRTILNPIEDSQVPETRTVTRNGTTYPQKVPRRAASQSLTSTLSHIDIEPDPESFGPSEDEIAESIEAEQADRARIQAILDAGDPLGEALKRITALERLLRAAEDLLESARHDNNLLVRQVKAMRYKLDKMTPPAQDLVEF